jgi:hypothetical protein
MRYTDQVDLASFSDDERALITQDLMDIQEEAAGDEYAIGDISWADAQRTLYARIGGPHNLRAYVDCLVAGRKRLGYGTLGGKRLRFRIER